MVLLVKKIILPTKVGDRVPHQLFATAVSTIPFNSPVAPSCGRHAANNIAGEDATFAHVGSMHQQLHQISSRQQAMRCAIGEGEVMDAVLVLGRSLGRKTDRGGRQEIVSENIESATDFPNPASAVDLPINGFDHFFSKGFIVNSILFRDKKTSSVASDPVESALPERENTAFIPESLRLVGAALALQQASGTAAHLVPLPGTDRVIVIGTAAEVARLLPAPAVETERATWVGIMARVRADMAKAQASESARKLLLQMLDCIDTYVRDAGLLDQPDSPVSASPAERAVAHDHSEGGHHD